MIKDKLNGEHLDAWNLMSKISQLNYNETYNALIVNHSFSFDDFFDSYMMRDDRFLVPLEKVRRNNKIDKIIKDE